MRKFSFVPESQNYDVTCSYDFTQIDPTIE
jgi:hypothetical protein